MKKRGFTLLEVLVVMALLALLLGLGWVSTRGTQDRARSQGLADRVVAELTAARAQAMAKQRPVAVVFPSQGGTTGLCQGLYWLEGENTPRVTRRLSFANEHPDDYIFVGNWALISGAPTIDRPVPGNEENWKLENWPLPAEARLDYVYVFTPQGTVLSNDLPIFDGAYHLTVGSRPTVGAAVTLPGSSTVTVRPPCFTLQSLAESHTIRLDTTGGPSVSLGVANSNVLEAPLAGPVASAGVTQVPAPASSVPVITSLDFHPGPGGTGQATIGPDGFMTLSIEATDADGDGLYCQWTSDGGAFTNPGPVRMNWDQNKGKWVSTWVFAGDPNDGAGKHYQLTCKVWDDRMNTATLAAGVTAPPNLEFRRDPRVAFGESGPRNLYEAGPDGTDFQQIPMDRFQCDYPCQSPDGNSLIFNSVGGGPRILYSMNKDGSALRRLSTEDACCASYSPDGTKIAFLSNRNGPLQLFIMPSCGEFDPAPDAVLPVATPLAPTLTCEYRRPSFNALTTVCPPDPNPVGKLVVTGGLDSTRSIYVYDFATKALTPVGPAWSSPNGFPLASYCPDPAHQNELLCADPLGIMYGNLFLIHDDGTNRSDVGQMGGTLKPNPNQSWFNPAACTSWSRDGKKVTAGYPTIQVGDVDLASRTVTGLHSISGGVQATAGAW